MLSVGAVLNRAVGGLAQLHKWWLRLRGQLRRRYGGSHRDPVLATYELMRADNETATALYKAGAFWEKINHEFQGLLWSVGLTDLRNQYFNRRFAGPDPSSRQVYAALLWLYYNRLLETDTQGVLRKVSEPVEGGTADQETVAGRRVSLDFLQSVEEGYRIMEAWKRSGHRGTPELIVELGAGYGRLAFVLRRLLPSCTYVILDLPEALICSSTWLGRVLPGEVVPYDESRNRTSFSRSELLARKLWTLGAAQIEHVAAQSVDCFVNIYSLAEMPKSSIDNYFAQIDRITRGVFYTKQRKRERNLADGLEVTAATYPVRPNWRTLFCRTSTLYEEMFEVAYEIGPRSDGLASRWHRCGLRSADTCDMQYPHT